ncbi:MAG: hypothetical protein K2N88_01200 [Muribaculaceae bacterium]|nr:hypothetical protein [Muribaculaceae bacterium]
MKKTLSILKKTFLGAFLVAVMASCSANLPTDADVAKKISEKSELSEADYTTMIDYCGKYAEKAQKYYDVINSQPNDSTAEYNDAVNDLANLYGEYVYIDPFRIALAQADMNQIGSDNEKKVNEYAKYQAFPLPGGAGANLSDPNAVGMIEQMPSTTTTDTTGVISTGDGVAVD